jgi:glycosyltransferase involved in cell wall biosynthesis
LEAVSDVPARIQSNMSLVLAGRIDADVQSDVDQKLRLIQSESPDLHIHVENRFIDRDALADWVSRSDVVLAPYQKAAGSSGVILWAASKGTPVLTQTYGLIGRYVAEHKLGVTTDTTDPRALAKAITQCVEHLSGDENTLPYSASDASAFIQRHAPENFARILISELSVA